MSQEELNLIACLDAFFATVDIDSLDVVWKDARALYNTLKIKQAQQALAETKGPANDFANGRK